MRHIPCHVKKDGPPPPAVVVLCAFIVFSATAVATAEDDHPPIDFAHDVVPILRQHCAECHGGEESEGGFSLNTRALVLDAGVAAPGNSAESEMILRVTSDDVEVRMPPADTRPLAAEKIATLRRWIDEGLSWEAGFSFAAARYEPPLRPRRPELPPEREGLSHPIDRIVDAYWSGRDIAWPEPVDDTAFVRRAYLDLIGLLPTPQQRAEFVVDSGGDKRARLVAELLARRQDYAEHWLTFWNDVLRNDYAGTGYIDGGRKQITTWLYDSLVDNKPYDQFVRELVAPSSGSEGFSAGIKWRGRVNASQTREIQFAQSVGQVFLGINLKCASCHDSFIDRWTLEETYGLAAVFATEPLELHRCDKPTGRMATPGWIFPELGQIDPAISPAERLAQLAALLTHEDNGRLTRTIVNRIWQRLMGRGIVHPVDAMQSEPYSADLLDYLGVHLSDNNYDLKKTIELVATSRVYQSRTIPEPQPSLPDEFVFAGPVAKRMTAEQFIDAIWQITGARPRETHAAANRPDPSAPVRASLVKSDLLMRALGRPNREQVVTTRPSSLTTLEAIDLANGQIMADLLARGVPILLEQYDSGGALSSRIYQHALSRRPTEDERDVATELLGEELTSETVEDFLWAVFMLPEFQLIR